jgi:hypothetical protein
VVFKLNLESAPELTYKSLKRPVLDFRRISSIAFSALSFFFVIIVPLQVTMSQMSLLFKQPFWPAYR